MAVKAEDKKLKIRLAKYGPRELFGPFSERASMNQDQLITCFDEIWDNKLRDAISQASVCDIKQALVLLTDGERDFFDPDQEHRHVRLQEEGLEFIAQIENSSHDADRSLTQLWKISFPYDHQNMHQSTEDLSDLGRKQLYGELIKKKKEAKEWSEIYYKLGNNHKQWYLRVGALAAILAILAGSSNLAEWFGELGPGLIGVITLIVGALTALQTFLDLSRQSEKLEAAGKEWGKLSRKIDQQLWVISFTDSDPQVQFKILKDVIEEMNAIEDLSPTIPSPVYEKAKQALEGRAATKKN